MGAQPEQEWGEEQDVQGGAKTQEAWSAVCRDGRG